MTEVYRRQLAQELRQAGYHDAVDMDDGRGVIPDPRYPNLVITPQGVRFRKDASLAERNLGYTVMTGIQDRASEAALLWDNGRELPKGLVSGDRFRLLSEYGDTLLAARDDGAHGLHFVTWEYSYDRQGVHHGHYTTAFAVAKEDFAVRAGLVDKDRLVSPQHLPLLFRALYEIAGENNMDADLESQVDTLCRQLRNIDPDVEDKAFALRLEAIESQDMAMEPEI